MAFILLETRGMAPISATSVSAKYDNLLELAGPTTVPAEDVKRVFDQATKSQKTADALQHLLHFGGPRPAGNKSARLLARLNLVDAVAKFMDAGVSIEVAIEKAAKLKKPALARRCKGTSLAAPELDKTSLDKVNDVLNVLAPPFNFNEVFTSKVSVVKDVTFTDVAASLNPLSFFNVDAATNTVRVTEEAKAALEHLHGLDRNGATYKAVVADLKELERRVLSGVENPTKGLETLELFTEYQIYKTGAHAATEKEETLNKLTAQALMKAYDLTRKGGTEDDAKYNGEVERRIVAKLSEHYMCKCMYTAASPALVAKDLPAEAQARLRVFPREVDHHLFGTSNGAQIAYDPKKVSLEDVTRHYKAEIAALKTTAEAEGWTDPFEVTYVPFDAERSMIAEIRVPVMVNAVKIEVELPNGEIVPLAAGVSPEEMGIKLSNKNAGVMRRSPNSQRVTQVNIKTDAGENVSLEFKGSGVPAYGFQKAKGALTGSEFLGVAEESQALFLRSFAEKLGYPNVVPQVGAVALVTDRKNASVHSELRTGAVMVRVDRSFGLRVGNTKTHGPASDETLAAKSEKLVGQTLDASWRTGFAETTARHLAIAHLFGLDLRNSSVTTGEDNGLHGQFSDTGELHPLSGEESIEHHCLTELMRRYASFGPDDFAKAYVETIDEVIAKVGDVDEGLKQRINERLATVMRDVPSGERDAKFVSILSYFGIGAERLHEAFIKEGMKGYAEQLAHALDLYITADKAIAAISRGSRADLAGHVEPYLLPMLVKHPIRVVTPRHTFTYDKDQNEPTLTIRKRGLDYAGTGEDEQVSIYEALWHVLPVKEQSQYGNADGLRAAFVKMLHRPEIKVCLMDVIHQHRE